MNSGQLLTKWVSRAKAAGEVIGEKVAHGKFQEIGREGIEHVLILEFLNDITELMHEEQRNRGPG